MEAPQDLPPRVETPQQPAPPTKREEKLTEAKWETKALQTSPLVEVGVEKLSQMSKKTSLPKGGLNPKREDEKVWSLVVILKREPMNEKMPKWIPPPNLGGEVENGKLECGATVGNVRPKVAANAELPPPQREMGRLWAPPTKRMVLKGGVSDWP